MATILDKAVGGTGRLLRALAVMMAVAPGSAMAQASNAGAAFPEIELGYPEQPPRVYTDAQGQPAGYYAHLAKILFAKAGMSWHGTSYPAPRLMKNLDQGTTNFSILVANPLLDKCCLYSHKPVWRDELRVYAVGAKPPIRTREDLIGKDVITLAGFSYGGLINFINDPKNRIRNDPAESHQAAFEMLDAGRAAYLLDYAEPAEAEGLVRHPVANLRWDKLDEVSMYFILNKSYPNAPQVMMRLEAIYEAMRTEDVKREYTR